MNAINERPQEDILATVLRATDPWFPELTGSLVNNGWEALSREMSISPATYSTTNVTRRHAFAPSAGIVASVPIEQGKFSGFVEFLADDVQAYFESKDYRFPNAHEVAERGLTEALSRALEFIALVPSLHASSSQLIRCVHLLQSTVGECDISFSEPGIPFSIFVSVPGIDSSNASLRLAEAVIHESMHLQLSLIEKVAPISLSKAPMYYSPWKRSNRDASGVLHALYVFTVIDAWLKRLPSSADSYSKIRRHEIAEQFAEISSFGSADLTEVGNALRRNLLSQH
jgi:HEXXH motif-containing protein